MQFEIDDQTDDASESTEPVAPGTSCCFQACQEPLSLSFAPFFG